MISPANQRVTRKAAKFPLAAGKSTAIYPNGDYFYVYSILDGDGVSRDVELSVNGDDLAPVQSGHSNQGNPGAGEVKKLEFTNTSGVDVTIIVIYGNGRSQFLGKVEIQGGVVSLSQDSIDSLKQIQTLKCGGVDITGSQAFANCKGISIDNKGAANAIITTPSGTNYTLGAGTNVEWSCENDSDVLETITVNATGTTCTVLYVYA